jgi:hypothetical protein
MFPMTTTYDQDSFNLPNFRQELYGIYIIQDLCLDFSAMITLIRYYLIIQSMADRYMNPTGTDIQPCGKADSFQRDPPSS